MAQNFRLIGRWRLPSGTVLHVKRIVNGEARVSLGGPREIVMTVGALEALREYGRMTRVRP